MNIQLYLNTHIAKSKMSSIIDFMACTGGTNIAPSDKNKIIVSVSDHKNEEINKKIEEEKKVSLIMDEVEKGEIITPITSPNSQKSPIDHWKTSKVSPVNEVKIVFPTIY